VELSYQLSFDRGILDTFFISYFLLLSGYSKSGKALRDIDLVDWYVSGYFEFGEDRSSSSNPVETSAATTINKQTVQIQKI
jgi:hypothetical protein